MSVDRKGDAEPLIANVRGNSVPRVSPDGSELLVQTGEGLGSQLRMIDLATGAGRRFTFEDASLRPIWTVDGRYVIYRAPRLGGSAVLMRRADGSDEPAVLLEGDLWPTSVSPDGVVALYRVNRQVNDRDIVTFDLDARVVTEFLATPDNDRNPRFSPGGQWIAYVSDASGRDEVWVRPAPGRDGPARPVSEGGGVEPAWAPDGSEIYYRDGAGNFMAVGVLPSATLVLSAPEKLFALEGRFEMDNTATWTNYDVHPNGRFVMISTSEAPVGSQRISFVLNWFEELKQRVPPP
jgi:serine/threonine-protein kinase